MFPILEALTLRLTFFSATVFAVNSQHLTWWHRQTISICCFRRPLWKMINQNRSLTFCSTQTMIHRVLGSHFMPPASVRNIMICHQQRIHLLPDKDGEEIGGQHSSQLDMLSLAYSLEILLWFIPNRGRQGSGIKRVNWWFPVLNNEHDECLTYWVDFRLLI